MPGFDDLTFAQFLDVVWADIFDDVGGFTDRHRYREAMHYILIRGEDPPEHPEDEREDTTDKKPTKPRGSGKKIPQAALDRAREMRERGMQKRAEANK